MVSNSRVLLTTLPDHKTPIERRKHERFKVQEGIFAAVTGDYAKLGPVVDASMGGLSFHYADEEQTNVGKGQTNALREMAIFSSQTSLYLSDVPFLTVSDFKLPSEVPLSSVTRRRRGVQFGELTLKQIFLLNHFVENYTIGEAQ